MGRPISKKFIGDPEKIGHQLVVSYVWLDDSTAPEEGFFITRQSGTRRYHVANAEGRKGIIQLVDAMPTQAGEGVIMVLPTAGGPEEYARTIYNLTVKTYDDNRYNWNIAGTGEAILPFEAYVSPAEAIELLQSITDAGSGSAVVTILREEGLKVMDSDTKELFDEIPVGSGREEAVGDGVAEWTQIYGDAPNLDVLKGWIKLHVETEEHKFAFITAVDDATSAKKLAEALATATIVSGDRQSMIAGLRESGVAAAITRADELAAEKYTTVLKQVTELSSSALSSLATELLAVRNAISDKKFHGILPIVNAIDEILNTEPEGEPE